MNMVLMVVYDVVAKCYLAPMFFATERDARYALGELCSDPKTKFNQHPDDFLFNLVADFSLHTGDVRVFESVTRLGSARDFIRVVDSHGSAKHA